VDVASKSVSPTSPLRRNRPSRLVDPPPHVTPTVGVKQSYEQSKKDNSEQWRRGNIWVNMENEVLCVLFVVHGAVARAKDSRPNGVSECVGVTVRE
jgi:hypothetical protein